MRMNNGVWKLVLAVAAGACLMAPMVASASRAGAAVAATPTSTAVVDVFKVIEELDEFKARLTDLATEGKKQEQALLELGKKLEEQAKKIKDMAPGPDRQKAEKAFMEDSIKAKSAQQIAMLVIEQMKAELIRETYEKVLDAVKRTADQQGIQLVLTSDTRMKIDANMDAEGANRVMAQRRVLYAHESVDLTNTIISLMNIEYKNPRR